jgi:hypothetical protein
VVLPFLLVFLYPVFLFSFKLPGYEAYDQERSKGISGDARISCLAIDSLKINVNGKQKILGDERKKGKRGIVQYVVLRR